MMLLWNIIRWVATITLLLDGTLFVWCTARLMVDVKRNPAEYAACAPSRLTEKHLFALFGGAGILFIALAFITIPL